MVKYSWQKSKGGGRGLYAPLIFRKIFMDLLIASATLSEVETLKHPSSHGIYFLDEIFRFSNLVSDFFSNWNFSRNECQLLVLRYCLIYVFDKKSYKNYFFILKLNIIKNFNLINSYTSFFKKYIYINFIGFITLVVERLLIYFKSLVAAAALLFLSRVLD